jgi:hypothetical protein
MIVFSLDLVRLSVDFLNFSNKSLMIEQQATSLIEDNSLDMVKAIKLMHEYQLARALGPMIPQVMFNIMRKDLHQMWRVYQGRNPLSK